MGIQDDPVEQTTGSQSLTLTVSPQNAGLDGAMFTCRATTYGGKVFEETITVQVKGNASRCPICITTDSRLIHSTQSTWTMKGH